MADLASPCPDDTPSPAADLSPSLFFVTNKENGVQNGAPLRSAATESHGGSTISGAVFNFTNCIIGAGAIGLGGAFALSGGIISVVSIIFFGVLTKLSLDLVISMSIQSNGSYETLGKVAFGKAGWIAVLMSNTLVILPLCCLRDMSSLTSLISAVSVVAIVFIVIIIIYLYIDNPGDSVRGAGGTLYKNWFEIQPGYLESLGTFVITFVSQHTVHVTYESIKSDAKSLENWKIVSTVGCHFACHRRVLDGWSNGLLHVLATRWQ